MNLSPSASIENRIVNRTVLKNGIVVLCVENPAADIIAARIFLRAGSRWEPSNKAGLAHLLSAVMTKGTDTLSSLEIAEKVESVGASLSADAASDYFLVSLKTVSDDFVSILELVGQLMRSPTFPQAEVELEKNLAIQGIRSQQEQPFAIAFDQLRRSMYPDHPYAFSTLGTPDTVAEISRADLEAFHQTYFRPENMVISLAGRLTPEYAVELVEQVFGDWQGSPATLATSPLPTLTPQPNKIIVPLETQQSIVMLGYLTPSVRGTLASGGLGSTEIPLESVNIEYAALKLLNTYLGNGLSSRLFVELREKRGLAYEVSALYPTRLDASQFVVYLGTAPENTATAIESLQMEVERLCTELLTTEELQSAKNKLLGQYALGKQTNAQLAQVFGWYETLGLGITFDSRFTEAIAAVSVREAQQAANRYFTQPYVSLVGPAAAVTPFSE